MLLIHNPRCSKSREALTLLAERGEGVQVREYLKAPLTAAELEVLFTALGVEPPAAIRFKDALAKSLEISPTDRFSRAEWIALIAEHPALLERPIAVKGAKAVIGRPPERVLDL